ncbi:AraC family transcriptional regulator [Nitratireductor sp. XY-223]|uniref:helix-turn-helix domain-containing protein n=1 Tax=Nitratireductor sp. XY-223 TaxID=2561926 RepID=UPI00145B09CC|nr:AraC family transcriptional regulator [Nitratireductor sp. XY-223]
MGRRHCFDAWREAVRCVFDVNPLSDEVSGTERMEGWLLDNLIFTEVAFSPQSFRHHARHAQDANYLSLQIYRSGGSSGVLADQYWKMEPGQVHIYDFSRQFQSVAEDSVVAGVKIPHEAIGYDPGRHPAHIMLSGCSPLGRFLIETYFAIQRRLPELCQEEASALAKGFCGLVRGILIPQGNEDCTEVKRSRAERRVAMRSYLDRHLSDPALGIDHLLRSFAVSRPSIYRDFANEGGVATYINRRRLDRAFSRLVSTTPSHGRIKEIANGVGFNDPAYFNRLFRQRFGIAPGAAITNRRPPGTRPQLTARNDSSLAASQLSNWFSSI